MKILPRPSRLTDLAHEFGTTEIRDRSVWMVFEAWRWRQGDEDLRRRSDQQQRVAIARARVHDPRLVVCDEPTSALDSETGRKVMGLMREVAFAKDRALVVVTHDERIFEFADRIDRMEDGRITGIADRPPATDPIPQPR